MTASAGLLVHQTGDPLVEPTRLEPSPREMLPDVQDELRTSFTSETLTPAKGR